MQSQEKLFEKKKNTTRKTTLNFYFPQSMDRQTESQMNRWKGKKQLIDYYLTFFVFSST
jgi:hypothetical protein